METIVGRRFHEATKIMSVFAFVVLFLACFTTISNAEEKLYEDEAEYSPILKR